MAEISGKGVPSSKTAGAVGDYYTDTDTSIRYKCELAYATKDNDGEDVVYYKWSKANPRFIKWRDDLHSTFPYRLYRFRLQYDQC